MGKLQTIIINLRRADRNQPWGISLVGGSDVNTPLIITRVLSGSACEGQLYRGDIITKIGDYDSRDIRHEDAENLFKNAANSLRIVIQRDISMVSKQQQAAVSSNTPSTAMLPPLSPLGLSPNPSVPYRSPSPAHSYRQTLQKPIDNLPQTIFPTVDNNEFLVKTITDLSEKNQIKSDKDNEIEAVLNQPYRTTPLVLPGAKARHEPPPTESYLRHHPNPSMRHGGHYLDHEVIMKQKVAENMLHKVIGEDSTIGGKHVVHKQFNSPINLYSEPNIVNTIRHQTVTPIKKNAVFDPSRSETLKALKEESYIDAPVQEVATPVVTKVYNPTQHHNRVPPARKVAPTPQINTANPYINSIGNDLDSIKQSGSFNRLMYNVLGQTDY